MAHPEINLIGKEGGNRAKGKELQDVNRVGSGD